MRENKKAYVVSFTRYQLNNYKVFSGLFYNTKPLTNYQNLQLITLLHEEKVEKIKNKKLNARRFLGNFARGCEISQGFGNSQPLQNFTLRNFAGQPKFATLANLTSLALHVLLMLLPSSMLLSSNLQLDSSHLDLNPYPQDIKSLTTAKLATKFD